EGLDRTDTRERRTRNGGVGRPEDERVHGFAHHLDVVGDEPPPAFAAGGSLAGGPGRSERGGQGGGAGRGPRGSARARPPFQPRWCRRRSSGSTAWPAARTEAGRRASSTETRPRRPGHLSIRRAPDR